MMALIEGHEGGMNLISRWRFLTSTENVHSSVSFSIDNDVASEIEHLTSSMDSSQETIIAGAASAHSCLDCAN
jgi:hypothetical protein